MDTQRIASTLCRALGRASNPPSFVPVAEGIHDAIVLAGIPVDRVQVPLTRDMGFRHPTLALVLLTWTTEDGAAGTEVITHEALDALGRRGVIGTPFEGIVERGERGLRLRLTEDTGGFAVLEGLRRKGYVDYCAFAVQLPSGDRQPISLASRVPMPDDVLDRLEQLDGLLGLAIYGAYRTSQAVRMAQVYIGHEAGPRVLAGEIQRGSMRRVACGIVFCDIRGFTQLSERVGAERVVEVVNQVFHAIESVAVPRGGEILKFIGDAMLMVFPQVDGPEPVARAMVEVAKEASMRVEALGAGVSVGFGCHIGEVVQANIGTPERLDFTVMGPAVNLASRLESLCKPLGAQAVFSDAVARHVQGLLPAGPQEVKGVAGRVETFVWRSR